LWPGGALVDTLDPAEAITRTKALISDPTIPAIFEGALVYHGVLVRVDALERLPEGRWRLNEVKSSTRIKDEHLEDIALQTYVIVGAGLELADAHLMYINDKYVRGEEIDWEALFCREDVSEDVARSLPEVPERIADMHEVLCSREAPDIRPSRHCFQPHDCEFWKRCTANKPKDWVFYIPRISSADFDELEGFEVISMRDVPKNFPLKPNQRRVVDVAKSGQVYRSPEFAKLLPLLAPPTTMSISRLSARPSRFIPILDRINESPSSGLCITMMETGLSFMPSFSLTATPILDVSSRRHCWGCPSSFPARSWLGAVSKRK
jgi:hypothetical protein